MMKVLVLWLDGAEPYFIERLKLPNMKDRFGWQPYSTGLPNTGAQLATFFLGIPIAKHGITKYRGYVEKFKEVAETTKPLWKKVNELGCSIGMLNMPFTYPPFEIDGWLVSGLGTEVGTVYTHPKNLWLDLDGLDYVIHPEVNRASRCYGFLPFERGNVWTLDVTFEKWMNCLEKRAIAAKHLITEHPVDVAVIGIVCLGSVGHIYNEMSMRVKEFYERVDELIGELIEAAKPEHVIMVSDHGFRGQQHTLPAYFSSSFGVKIDGMVDVHNLIMEALK